jgi:hypothetical protein
MKEFFNFQFVGDLHAITFDLIKVRTSNLETLGTSFKEHYKRYFPTKGILRFFYKYGKM